MKRLILFLCTIALFTELSAQTAMNTTALKTQYSAQKFKVQKAPPDSVLQQKADWDKDTVIVKGDPLCHHVWETVPGGERQKYADAPDSLQSILNPNHEREVQEKCIICNREWIKSETITWIWKKKKTP